MFRLAILLVCLCGAHQSNEAHGRLNEAHGQLNEAHGRLNEAHGQSNEAHGQLNDGYGQSNEAHGQLNEAHGHSNEAHGQSNEAHGQLNKPHDQSNDGHGQFEQAHNQSNDELGQLNEGPAQSNEEHGRSDEIRPVLTRLPYFIHEFCPGVNICSDNISIVPIQTSCCTECSCQPDCTVDGNCCFPKDFDSYNDSKRDNELGNNQTCLYPMLPQPRAAKNTKNKSFAMITLVQEDNVGSSNKIACGDIKVAPWGSMHPVYSAKAKQIYKNMECAEADGITDGSLWTAKINCPSDEVDRYLIGLQTNTFPDKCSVTFKYPDDIGDLQTLNCTIQPIDTCPESQDFQVPRGTSLSKSDIITLCTSGLVSPYQTEKSPWYANIFCQICNNEDFSKYMICDPYADYGGREKNVELLSLFDVRSKAKEIVKHKVIAKACSFENTNECRPVFCPIGQLRNSKGVCAYPYNLWYNRKLSVYVNLTSAQLINVAKLFQVSGGWMEYVLPSINSPWGQDWVILDIFYKETDDKDITNNFLVLMATDRKSVKPSNLINYIKKTVQRQWLFEVHNETVALKSFLSKILRSPEYTDPLALPRNISENHVAPRYLHKHMKVRSLTRYDRHAITKLYLCDQVELHLSEFTLSPDNGTLYIYANKRLLFNGEFILTENNNFDGIRARICIEDFGMYKKARGMDILKNIATMQRKSVTLDSALGLVFAVLCIRYQTWTFLV